MALILNIETSADACSVAIANGGQLIVEKELLEPRAHASQLTSLIKQCALDSEIALETLNAVAVSSGPGSYTGIRIGVATATGLCYGLNIPLIALNTLLVMAAASVKEYDCCSCLVGFRARKDEYYSAAYSKNLDQLLKPQVLRQSGINQILKSLPKPVVVSASLLPNGSISDTAVVSNFKLRAKEMAILSYRRFVENDFMNPASFRPDYLKPVHVG